MPPRVEESEDGTEVVTAGEIAMLETADDETVVLEADVGETAKLEVDAGDTTKLELEGAATVPFEVDDAEITMDEMGEPEITVLGAADEMLPLTDEAVLLTNDTVPSVCEVNVRIGACKVVVLVPTSVPTVELFEMVDCVV